MKISYKKIVPFMLAGASMLTGCVSMMRPYEVIYKKDYTITYKDLKTNCRYRTTFDATDSAHMELYNLINEGDQLKGLDFNNTKYMQVPADPSVRKGIYINNRCSKQILRDAAKVKQDSLLNVAALDSLQKTR